MKKPYSLRAELRALRTICLEPESRAAQFLLAKLKPESFATGVGKHTYARMRRYIKKDSLPPDWEDLVTDPGLDQSVRKVLSDCDLEPVSSKRLTNNLVRRLEEYRKQRMLIEVGRRLEKAFKSPEPFDTDDLIQDIQTHISGISRTQAFKAVHIGVGSNVRATLSRLLEGTAITYIPTGFNGFDSKNRGISMGSLFMLAGPTGSGKSLILGALANNLARHGAKVAFVPLEMTNDETVQRDIARNANVDMTDLLDPENRISSKQRQRIEADFMEWDRKTRKRGGKISYIEFEEDINAESAFATLKPYDYDVIIIDYIGLFSGLDGDDQWKAMRRATRYAKVWARTNKKIVIMAAQLSEEGMLRHSKAMKDDCNFMWSWRVDENTKATGVLEINQDKARQASDHSFLIKLDYPRMKAYDASQEDIDYRAKLKEGKAGKKSQRRWENEESSGGWDTGDEEEETKVSTTRRKREYSGGFKSNNTRPKKRRENVSL